MNNDFLIEGLARKRQQDQQAVLDDESSEKDFTITQFDKVTLAVIQATEVLLQFLREYKIDVKNFPDFPKSISTPDVKEVVKAIKALPSPEKADNTAIVKGIEDLAKKIENIPLTEAVEVSNLNDLKRSISNDLKDLLGAVRGLEMKPKITIPAPVVNVPEIDTKSITKALEAVKKAVDEKPVPGVSVTPTDPLIRYTPADIDDAGAVQYFGYVDQRGGWYIRKYDTSSSPKTLRFAFGNTAYPTNFTNRASLTYAIWGS